MTILRYFKKRTLSLPGGLAISGVVHFLLLAGLVIVQNVLTSIPPIDNQALQIDLFGLLSDRQVEEREGEDIPPPPPPPPEEPPPVENIPEPQVAPPEPPPITPETVVTKEEAPPPAPKRAPRPAPRPKKPPGERQRRQTISRSQLEASLMREYLTRLTKSVRSNLVYPPEAKLKGQTGDALIAFTIRESGRIQPNTVRVKQSTGFRELDIAAMRAVQSVGMIPRPPKKMEVVITINFRKDS